MAILAWTAGTGTDGHVDVQLSQATFMGADENDVATTLLSISPVHRESIAAGDWAIDLDASGNGFIAQANVR